ncbi:MAG: translation elongation factor Ts [Candidatus Calescibacterium sp.]|nr:translation elongation factor Ts [Candidatus Calescibacterium sp.]MCX7972675.1 translation elongation factor Ts [bacterium]MDW8194728.1 translation elongation factor Ts [Candidatus Calescibacterium sp.]
MSISMDLIKQLREETGAGMTDCKNALIESNGDIEKARRILLAKGAAKAVKKLDRLTKEGVISIKNNGSKAVMIELACETDFVARNEKFIGLAKNISEFLFEQNFSSVEEALKLSYNGKDLQTYINENISIFGENIKLSRAISLEVEKDTQVIFDYLHFNNRVGVLVLVEFEKPFSENQEEKKEFGNKTVFQIASMKPLYVDLSSVPPEEIEEQKKMAFEQAKSEGKPDHIAQKIAEGKVNKIFEDSVLFEQTFYDDSLKIPKFKDYMNFVSSKIGEKILVRKFVRFEISK